MDEFDETAKKLVEEWYEKDVVLNPLKQSDLENLQIRIAAALRAQKNRFVRPKEFRLNLNARCRVKVLDLGAKMIAGYFARINMGVPEYVTRDRLGFVEMSLWQLANYFGEAMYMGAASVIEMNVFVEALDEVLFPHIFLDSEGKNLDAPLHEVEE